jgi:(1->4)-alpha-D-glucan 1-alpha-D-glucosylmutase
LLQSLLGAWPCELLRGDTPDAAQLQAFAERIRNTMLKSMREARVHTGWAFPNAAYEDATLALIDAALTGNRAGAFLTSFVPFVRQIANCGVDKSLVQTVLKLTSPGVPDLYNGTELWDLSMVDPDNRRPVDYALRANLLRHIDARLQIDRAACMRELRRDWCDAGIKLATIATVLRHRQAHERLYSEGDYQSLPAAGQRADDLCAYARTRSGDSMIVVATRRARRSGDHDEWRDTLLPVPEHLRRHSWLELLTGRSIALQGDSLRPSELFADLPVAVLSAPADPDTAGAGQ